MIRGISSTTWCAPAPPVSVPSSPTETAPLDVATISATTSQPPPAHTSSAAASTIAAATGSAVAAGLFAGLESGFVLDYVKPAEVLERARGLAQRYPDLVELVERPYQTHGYDGKQESLRGPAPLYYLRLGPRDDPRRDDKTGVLQIAAPHAREWMQPMIMLELAEQLLVNYDPSSKDTGVRANTALLQGLDVYLVPQSNPDGANYSFHDDDMWRKNRNPEGGVDVNRNYDYNWKSSADTTTEVYPGKKPLSEPETRHLVQLVDEHPNIQYVCDWHSFGQEVRRPWGVSPEDAPVYDRMHSRMADAIGTVRGRQYATVTSTVTDGASDDYFYHRRNLYSTIVEDGTDFHPSREEAITVMREGVAGARELLQVALESGTRWASPPAEQPPDPPA